LTDFKASFSRMSLQASVVTALLATQINLQHALKLPPRLLVPGRSRQKRLITTLEAERQSLTWLV
jgi:hypothetical protein